MWIFDHIHSFFVNRAHGCEVSLRVQLAHGILPLLMHGRLRFCMGFACGCVVLVTTRRKVVVYGLLLLSSER